MGTSTDELWMSPSQQETVIISCAIISIVFGLYNVWCVMSIHVAKGNKSQSEIEM